MAGDRVIHVAVEVGGLHLDRMYEYLPPTETTLEPGMLVGVSFAGRSVRALVLACDQPPSIAITRLKLKSLTPNLPTSWHSNFPSEK